MPKAPSLQQIRSSAAGFAHSWRDEEGYERGQAQSFVRDLLGVFGVTESRAAVYEMRAQRSSTGSHGYIDALVPGLVAIEMKSAGKDLEAAEQQALDYLDSLSDAEMPRYVLTSDFKRFRLVDLQESAQGSFEFGLDELPVEVERLAFLAGYGLRQFGSKEQEAASIKAAQLMAGIWEQLEGSGFTDHEASVFMVRTLFALYADDAAVWERDLFLEFIETRTSEDGSDLGAQLSVLFQAMARPTNARMSHLDELVQRFPYVNGDIYQEVLGIPAFNKSMRDTLLTCCAFNWSEISPAIFGSLFQAVKDSKARRGLGEHYTTETNILKLIRPMFLDRLRERFEDGYHDAAKLRALRRDMGKMRFLDPAAGCGNFLLISYQEMRRLDLDVLLRLQDLGVRGVEPTLMFDADDVPVRLEHFHGIEIEEWPAQIARTALHLAEHQANQAMELALGQGPETLPLNKFDSIYVGNAITTDWSRVVEPTQDLFILGNPPFIGISLRSDEQIADLKRVWGVGYHGSMDYVTAWYAKAVELFAKPGYGGEFAFVSTNSITQGEPVPSLFRPVFSAGWRIKFGHRTFAWTSEAPGAAAVHCVIIGFDKHPRRPAMLFDYHDVRGAPHRVEVTEQITAYLVDGPNVLVDPRSQPLCTALPTVRYGNKPTDGGNLIVEPADYESVSADPIAAQYLRRFVGARELLHDEPRWCLWLQNLNPADLKRSRVLGDRVEAVRNFRLDSTAETTRAAAATAHLFRQIAATPDAYICIPRHVSETRAFFPSARMSPEVIASDATFVADDPDGFAFAVLSSTWFILWQRVVGGRIKSDLRFNKLLTWNTFPLPRPKDEQRSQIIAGGQAVLDARAQFPNRSLADHYNPLAMDPALLRAHRALDAALDRVFGAKAQLDDHRRVGMLFASYERLIGAEQLRLPKSRRRA